MTTTGNKIEVPPHLWRAAQGLAAEAGTSPQLQVMKALRVGLDVLAAQVAAPSDEDARRAEAERD